MTRLYRLLKIAKFYSHAIAEKNGWQVITESDIFSVLKNIPNIMMVPNSYSIDLPSGHVYQPWGPTIKFNYLLSGLKPKDENWGYSGKGNQKIIQNVQNSILRAFQKSSMNYIDTISTQYNGGGSYTVTITQKP